MLQLLDLAGIYFRAFYAVPTSITSPDGRPVNAVLAPVCAKLTVRVRPSKPVTDAFGATIDQTNFLVFFSSSRISGPSRTR